ncbi:MAG: hypothetical protein KC613_06010 [Myxococcales bacterium]|nr:hypothetical protein [Myxococcales bacterium]
MGWTAFERGEFLPVEDRPRWQAWAREHGGRLLLPWLAAGAVEAGLFRAMHRKGPFDGPDDPPWIDVGAWALVGRWWVAVGVVMTPGEVVFEVDAVRRDTLRAVGVAHQDPPPPGAEDPALQVEFDLEGAGFPGLAGRRWATGPELMAVSEEGDPLLSGPTLAPDVGRFLQALLA